MSSPPQTLRIMGDDRGESARPQVQPPNPYPEQHNASGVSSMSNSGEKPAKPEHFVPLQDDEAAGLPALNFRPLALQFWYLMFVFSWMLVCIGDIVTLAVMGKKYPTKLHLEAEYSYNIWLYSPGLIGFLTTILWRGTFREYNRLVPYIRMANLPISPQPGDKGKTANISTDILSQGLIAVSGEEVNIVVLGSLWRAGDYTSFLVNATNIFTVYITPLKSGVFQLVDDSSGVQVRVSLGFCVAIIIIYFWHLAVTATVAWHLRHNKTGLR